MLTPSSLAEMVAPWCVQVMEVRGRLKAEMVAERVKASPLIMVWEITWSTDGSTTGGTEMYTHNCSEVQLQIPDVSQKSNLLCMAAKIKLFFPFFLHKQA